MRAAAVSSLDDERMIDNEAGRVRCAWAWDVGVGEGGRLRARDGLARASPCRRDSRLGEREKGGGGKRLLNIASCADSR